MKKIQLTCFAGSESCQIVSVEHKIEISDSSERQFALQIANQSLNDCQLRLTPQNQNLQPSQSDSLPFVNLLVANSNRILFQGSLDNFFKQQIDFGNIEAQTSQEYLLDFDLFNLSLAKQKFLVNFDLLFDFQCQASTIQTAVLSATASSQVPISSQAAVLAATVSADIKSADIDRQNWHPFFYFLSSLFILIFFVIIKFVHGKKKKQ